jgi:altronate hydrolase
MQYIKIHPADNVAVALTELHAGESIATGDTTIRPVSDIPAGHKFALEAIPEKGNVIKYGYPIGHARQAIAPGEWINEKTIQTNFPAFGFTFFFFIFFSMLSSTSPVLHEQPPPAHGG